MKRSFFWPIIGLAAVLLVAVIGYRMSRGPSHPTAKSGGVHRPGEQAAGPVQDELEAARRDGLPQDSGRSPVPSVFQPASRATVAPATPRPEPTPQTRALVSSLSQLNFAGGPVTPEQVEKWRQAFKDLVQQGAAAVPAIREFLEKNLEVDYPGGNGGNPLGHASLRSALIDALQQIGGPEATEAMLQTLQSTTLPTEIALLAKYLDQQSPEQYRSQAMAAAREVMAMAAQGQLPKWDMGPLFQMYQSFGGATSATELESQLSQWKYYANMGLAGLPDGQGVPYLIRQLQEAPEPGKSDFPAQMLAQMAGQSPEAGAALLEQAALGTIPDSVWRKIAAGLAGEQFQIGMPSPGSGAPTAVGVGGIKTYHIEAGNQNFSSLRAVLTPEQVAQRRQLIDQLLAVTKSPAAIQALQSAQASLSATTP